MHYVYYSIHQLRPNAVPLTEDRSTGGRIAMFINGDASCTAEARDADETRASKCLEHLSVECTDAC